MAKLWKGEAAKVRRRVLGAVNTRMKKRVGESDLGYAWARSGPVMRGHMNIAESGDSREDVQARLYAAAMGLSLDDARARIATQLEAVGASFVPGKGYVSGA